MAIKIAVVGTGGMATFHADAFGGMKGCKLVSCCDYFRDKADAFAEKHNIPEVYDNIDELLAHSDVDAVTVVSTDVTHCELAMKSIAKGKHVLCEKPLATNYADARRMASAAKKKGIINMVQFSYRNSSAIHKAAELIRKGTIGRIVHFQASYLQCWLSSKGWGDWKTSPQWLWRLSKKHGSKGVLGDIGVHIIDFATYPIGSIKKLNCKLKTFTEIKGKKRGEYPLDANDSAVMHVETEDGALGVIHTTRWATGYANALDLQVFGEKGAIRLNLDRSYTELDICSGKNVDTAQWKTINCGKTPSIFQRFIKSIKTGKNDQPDFARGAAVQKVLDKCFVSNAKNETVTL
jgi:predicted dehydrogenase